MPNPELQRQLASIDELLHKIESAADPSMRTSVRELVELVMNLHGAGLERMLELIHSTGDDGEAVVVKLGSDNLAGSLLILHGLHPLTLESRVSQALDKVRSQLRPHGGEIELLSVQEGAVTLKLHAKEQGCGSTGESLKQLVENAVLQAAPDLRTLTIQGAAEKQGFVPLQMLLENRPAPLVLNGKGGL